MVTNPDCPLNVGKKRMGPYKGTDFAVGTGSYYQDLNDANRQAGDDRLGCRRVGGCGRSCDVVITSKGRFIESGCSYSDK